METKSWNDLGKTIHDSDLSSLCEKQAVSIAHSLVTSLEAAIQAALSHLHTSIGWSFAVLIGSIGVLASEYVRGSATFSGMTVALMLLLMTNFCVRSSKNYVNIIRFNVVHRRALSYVFAESVVANSDHQAIESYRRFFKATKTYRIEWVSPLTRRAVLNKVFLEFGFIIHFVFVIAAIVYVVNMQSFEKTDSLVLIVGAVFSTYEFIYFFFVSPYMRYVEIDNKLWDQR